MRREAVDDHKRAIAQPYLAELATAGVTASFTTIGDFAQRLVVSFVWLNQ